MLEQLLALTDRPPARLCILFVFAAALFLNRDLVGPRDATYEMAREPAVLESMEPPKPTPVRPKPWRQWRHRPVPPPVDVEAGYRSLAARVKADLIRLGYRTPAFLAMAAEYSDRRLWHEIRADYEGALRRGDLRAAMAVLKGALERVPPDNPMLKRELLEHLLQLELALPDVAGAETTFKSLLEAGANVARAWSEELKANPDLCRRVRMDPNAPLKLPTPDEVAAVFGKLSARARSGRPPFVPSPEEWAAVKERAALLRQQGKIDDATLRALQSLGQGSPGTPKGGAR